jgi:hypothetical protein
MSVNMIKILMSLCVEVEKKRLKAKTHNTYEKLFMVGSETL